MRIAITTLGCKINQYDSAVIQEGLAAGRHSFVPFDGQADFYIINTCTVTDRADWEARQLVRRAKRLSPGARVLVTGCYAQVNPAELARVPGVDFVVGLNRLDDLLRFVNQRDLPSNGQRVSVGQVKRERRVALAGAKALPDHTRAFLKIQEGCNYACTYCIIPTARGLSRSVPPEEVLSQVGSLARQGFNEIVLTGIHLGGYGHDLFPRADLASLLERIIERRLIPRLRLSSLDPREMPERLMTLVAHSDVLCPHLHVCAQAGDDGLLKLMRRNYDTAYYRELMVKAREILPDAALGSDIIVGFPGESEERFERSMAFFESLPLTYFHVFPYSVRKGTIAATLPEQVPLTVKKERAKKMRELGAAKRREFYHRFVGRVVRILVEQAVEGGGGFYRGYARNYLPVLVSGREIQLNREVEARIHAMEHGWLKGSVIGE